MPIEQRGAVKVRQRRERRKQIAIRAGCFAGAAVFVYCWRLISEKTIWMFVTDTPNQAADLAGRMVPPKWTCMEALSARQAGACRSRACIEGPSRHRPAAASYAATISSARLRTSSASNPGV